MSKSDVIYLPQTKVNIILAILSLLYIFIPFTNDVLVSFGAAFQADYYGKWFENVNQSWNIRGFFYKHILYLYSKAYFIFFDTINYTFFPIFIKILHLFILLPTVFLGLKQSKKFLNKHKINYLYVFYTFVFTIFTSSHFIALQAEEFSFALFVIMFGLSLSDKKWHNYFSAFLLLPLIGLKGITIFYAAFLGIFMLFLLYKKEELNKIIRFFISYILMSFVIILLYFTLLKFELNDLISATYFQKSFQISFISFLGMIKIYIIAIFHIPVLLLLAYLIVVYIIKNRKEYVNIIFLSFLLLIAIVVIVFQNKFFPYHYVIFLPVFLFVLFYFSKNINFKILLFLFLFSFLFRFIPNYKIPDLLYLRHANLNYFNSIFHTKYKNYSILADKILPQNEEILFLSDGTPNYFILNKSYLRYFYPLPLQRVENNSTIIETDIYQETLNKLLQYKGNYILLQPNWFNLNLHPSIKQKIENEYQLIFQFIDERTPSGSIFVYEKNSD